MCEYHSCWLCGRNGNGDPLERHHIFGGANRRLSEKYDLVVFLCGNRCHRNGKDAVHNNRQTMLRLHQFGERKWIDDTGLTKEDFRKEFGANYL